MGKMVLHPTPIAQWQALVSEASMSLGTVALSEELESYLVFLLMRFMDNAELSGSVMAIEFLNSVDRVKTAKEASLREVGDKCLLFAGFFPELARRRRVNMSYYVELGRSAYASLSSVHHQTFSTLFARLSHDFILLVDILHSMRALDTQKEALDVMAAEELWRDTNSQYAKSILKKYCPTFSPIRMSHHGGNVKQ
ncbi:MAG: hypothetical protein RLZ35_1248 [Pseudomonadota bacterium]|jgi:hypothetical protein